MTNQTQKNNDEVKEEAVSVEITPKSVLEGAAGADFKEVIVIGVDAANQMTIATTLKDYAAISWVLDVMKNMILTNGSK